MAQKKWWNIHTSFSRQRYNSACSRDMTWLSNQALFIAQMRPLLGLFEDLPIGTTGFWGVSRINRLLGPRPFVMAEKVTSTVIVVSESEEWWTRLPCCRELSTRHDGGEVSYHMGQPYWWMGRSPDYVDRVWEYVKEGRGGVCDLTLGHSHK